MLGSPASADSQGVWRKREALLSHRGARSHGEALFGRRGSHIWPVGLPAVLGSPASADKTSSATGMPCSAAEAASYIFSAQPRHPILALLPPPEPLSIPWGISWRHKASRGIPSCCRSPCRLSRHPSCVSWRHQPLAKRSKYTEASHPVAGSPCRPLRHPSCVSWRPQLLAKASKYTSRCPC